MAQSLPKAVFGYGSLINLATHSMGRTNPATLSGWRRVWVHAAARPVAFLSIEPHATTLHGRIIDVPDQDWATLDAREHAYLRHDINAQILHSAPPRDVVAYKADPAHIAPPSTAHPILLSYLDVVIAGCLDLMGDAGAEHFFDTTNGWGPVLDDRTAPLYPRAQPLTPHIQRRVDDGLRALAVPVRPGK